MSKLNFTPEQRFMIAMLCDLYKAPDKREMNPSFILSAIVGGHDWALEWEYGGLLPEETDTDARVKFVTDVLEMWEFIELTWNRLSNDDKQKVHDAVPYLGDGPEFPGFDGNNEVDYMAIAQILIEQMNRFQSFKGRGLNSHAHTLDRYGQMLKKWPDIRAGLHVDLMTPDQLIELLSRN